MVSYLEIISIVISFFVVILSLTTESTYLRKAFPFYRKVERGFKKLYLFDSKLKVDDKNGKSVEVTSSSLKKGEDGFNEIRIAILLKRPMIKDFQEIGIAKATEATNVDWGTGDIIPGEIGYVKNGDIIHTIIKDPKEYGIFEIWTEEVINRKIVKRLIFLIAVWMGVTVLSVIG